MQKNNCKLKTIFKKGLSFSIALALGAAATSLNLAKTAEATAPGVTSAKTVYLAGEKVEQISGATKLKVNGNEVTENPMSHIMATSDTELIFGDNETPTNWSNEVNVTVYDWDEINATGESIKIKDGTTDTDAKTAILKAIKTSNVSGAHGSEIEEKLNNGTIKVGGSALTDIDYDKHNGKEITLTSGEKDFTIATLEVTSDVKSVDLKSAPTKQVYINTNKTIDLTGLALTVTYAKGSPVDIEWTAETKDDFELKGKIINATGSTDADVKHGEALSNSIYDIKVTYDGKETTKTFDLALCSTQTSDSTTKAIVSVMADTKPTVDLLDIDKDSKDTLLADFSAEEPQVIFAKNVIAANYKYTVGQFDVKLYVGTAYKGEKVTVKHLASDDIETYIRTVDENGYVEVSVDSLSPFMVVLGVTEADKKAAEETEKKNEEADKDEDADKNEATKKDDVANAENTATVAPTNTESVKTADSKGTSKSVKTGDASVIAFSVFGFVALVSAAVLAFMKKNRKNLEK